jgi:alpha-D-xyloside xylohydrolase
MGARLESAMLERGLGRATLAAVCAMLGTLASGLAHVASARELTVDLPAPKLLRLPSPTPPGALRLDGFFYETAAGRVWLPATLAVRPKPVAGAPAEARARLSDGRQVVFSLRQDGDDFVLRLRAEPGGDVVRWGLAIEAGPEERFTGLMERVVDGPQQASWAPGIQAALGLRGQTVDMIVKPTTSLYAPFYVSSRGYGVFVKGDWPGRFDFCASDQSRVQIAFEGPSLELKIYASGDPLRVVQAHALEAGPPFLPPRWMYRPWRWRDEHTQREAYYDGTPVTGPFNSEVMEDVLMMEAFGIPCGVYWVDRPYGPGPMGYDDFEIDPRRLPHFPEMVSWLDEQQTKLFLWIAPFFQGRMKEEALARGYGLPGQQPTHNNYPLVDFTNPEARKYWQDGVAKLLALGVAGFKLDRSEEDIPDGGPFHVFDGRSVRENRNAYPVMYVQAAFEIARRMRGDDFVLMPRAAYTGSSPYAAFWGGDIGGTQEGLRASIVAVQRAAVMGYPNWGSDTCGYNEQRLEQEVCGRWLAFSAFTPIMEVGPTRNRGFWDLPREPAYDADLIAIWRLYARLHDRLADYSHRFAQEATRTGMPIVRPVALVDPASPAAWSNWWTYLYGSDVLVSPIWEKGQRRQEVYLPSGSRWRDAWRPTKEYDGGQTIRVAAELHQIPVFVRVGSSVSLGDLDAEWAEARAAAARRPDLKALDAEVRHWLDTRSRPNAAP